MKKNPVSSRIARWTWCGVLASLGLSVVTPAAARCETIRLQGGQVIDAEVLKETEEDIFLDLGFTVLGIPKRQVRSREATPQDSGGVKPPAALESAESVYFTRSGERGPIKRHAEVHGDAVVRITTPSGLGSGFVVNAKEGYIVTNEHVISREQRITVTFFMKKGSEFEKISREKVRIIAMNPFLDMALLKVEDIGDLSLRQVYLSPGDDDLRVGDPVFAIGNPLGLERSVSEGIVSKTDREFEGVLYIQTTAAINPGNSGGPLFNEKGEVTGITNMKATFAEGLGFAIPISALKYFLKHREAFAYDKDHPNSGFRYLPPPSRKQQ